MTTDDITSLIPQRPPILMVDRFSYEDDSLCHSELTLKEDNMFLHNGSMVPEGLLEHIAQTAAAHIGYRRKMAGEEVNLGFIGDIKRCTMGKRMPTVGQTVMTTMRVVSQVGNITMVSAESTSNGETLIECRMKLAN
ncbi:MAG: hydroxymyristoyl-ACP dehydratase [Bacteroidales bacterium]|nr:hydroxymyristoyl-ACP dehydratase [Bacteroidales bacterium]